MIDPETLIGVFETSLSLDLAFLDVPVRVLTNDEDIWAGLGRYYSAYVRTHVADPVAVVRLIQGEVRPAGEFFDVIRGGGRTVKEAVQDWPGGRFILKKATGVVMALWPGHAFAAGDVRRHLNQGVNLVNACYAKSVARRGHLLLHASGVSWSGRTAALAGPPGAGKSTAALHFVEGGFRFLSNDRILARSVADGVEVLGYPKQPRVNPGTLLSHPRLRSLLKPEEREDLEALPPRALYELERKSDVDLEAIYGPGTVELAGQLRVLALLKWRLDGEDFRMRHLETAEALANVPFLHKDLGVFDLDRPTRVAPIVDRLTEYADLMGRVTVVEVTGPMNHLALIDFVGDLLAR